MTLYERVTRIMKNRSGELRFFESVEGYVLVDVHVLACWDDAGADDAESGRAIHFRDSDGTVTVNCLNVSDVAWCFSDGANTWS